MKNFEECGPPIFMNWIYSNNEKQIESIYEIPLFSDAQIKGEAIEGLGPYKFFNPVAIPVNFGNLAPAIILRVEKYYLGKMFERLRKGKTDDESYHGGWLNEEVAAVASLLMGIRLKPGGMIRYFDDTDSKGKPLRSEIYNDPILSPARGILKRMVIPRADRGNLEEMELFNTIPDLQPEAAIALVKSSRLYQDGLWIADSEPELSWILFTSSIETAANYWKFSIESPLERMTSNKPELRELLESKGGIEFAEDVAELISEYMGSTKKFVDFIIKHIPDPPKERPPKKAQIDWTRNGITKIARKVYFYRSRKLHSGKSIPLPMCEPPGRIPGSKILSERMYAPMMASGEAVWELKDVPINLHTFEYITRGVLLNWWKSL